MKTVDDIIVRKRLLIKDGIEWIPLNQARQAMEDFYKENLREEYIQFLDWNKYSTGKRIAELINFDEYLKQKQ